MPQIMPPLPITPPAPEDFPRKRWTARECRSLVETGLLTPGKFELIEGDIVFKMGQSRLHVFIITRLITILSAIYGLDAIQSQAPIGIGEQDEQSDPEPDVAVLKGTVRDYLNQEPDPARDIHLIAEASDTTLRGDITTKARIYARNGVPEYWVVDIRGRRLLVHRQPGATGYAEVIAYAEDESLAPLSAPAAIIVVRDLLP